jgi:NAD(P)-dependent dehydrogenase (short-subunit alcohol dehydrogenase family)
LVTGGGRRIGSEIALTLARAGANVAFTYLNSANQASDTASRVAALGVRSLPLHCDLRDAKAVRSNVQEAIANLGRLDLLVNNAGSYETKKFDEISVEDWDDMFAVNVRSAFLMTQVCQAELRGRQGRVINIGSLGGIRPWATHAHYCASKAALHMLTQCTAKALAPEIKVNCVAPGMIDQGESERGSETLDRSAARTPMQRNGSAMDVAQAVLFFATCPEFITGQILAVDGGLTLS